MRTVVKSIKGVISFMESSFKKTRRNFARNINKLVKDDPRDSSEIANYMGLFGPEKFNRFITDDHNITLKQICLMADVLGVKPSELLEERY